MQEDSKNSLTKGCDHLNAGRFDAAIKLFSSILDKSPNDAEVLNYLGLAWNAKGEFDKAIENFDQALRINPHHKQAYLNRGNTWAIPQPSCWKTTRRSSASTPRAMAAAPSYTNGLTTPV